MHLHFQKLDNFFMPPGYEVHPLEIEARKRMIQAIEETRSMKDAIAYQNSALRIRNTIGWSVYRRIEQ